MPKLPLFSSGSDGYHTFRIPALAAFPSGVVLAFAEGRVKSYRDDGAIHLVMKRSQDGGKTFGPLQALVTDQRHCDGNGNGNPTPVVDRETGELHFIFRKGFTRIFIMTSKDEGLTWSKYREITQQSKNPEMKWFMTGPGHGIQLESGRLIVGGAHTTDGPWPVYSPEPQYLKSHALISDDHGKTWRMGGLAGTCSDECMPVELPGGKILMALRNGHPKKRRAFSTSKDGGESFSKMTWAKELKDPMCQAAILGVQTKNDFLLYYAGPHHDQRRLNLSLFQSQDLGKSWQLVKTIHPGPSAYCDLIQINKTHIGLLYEAGKEKYWESLKFQRIPITTST